MREIFTYLRIKLLNISEMQFCLQNVISAKEGGCDAQASV